MIGFLGEAGQWLIDFFGFYGQQGGTSAGNAASAWGVEDLFSNKQGALFAQDLWLKERDGICMPLSTALSRWFDQMEIGDKSDAPSFSSLPKTELEWQEWWFDDAIHDGLEEKDGAWTLPPNFKPKPRPNSPFPYRPPTDRADPTPWGYGPKF
jgi:hypothetical protein